MNIESQPYTVVSLTARGLWVLLVYNRLNIIMAVSVICSSRNNGLRSETIIGIQGVQHLYSK